MSEANMWQTLRAAFTNVHEHAVRVENAVEAGTPDVNVSFDGYEGWIELKYVPTWPVKVDTPVRVPRFTQQQRLWLAKRWRINGTAHLLLRVDRDWFLFDGDIAAEFIGEVERARLEELASGRWSGRLDTEELRSVLTMRFPHGRPLKRRRPLVEARRRRLLRMFQNYELEHGEPPSIKFLSRRTGLNVNVINRALNQLAARGDLETRRVARPRGPGKKHREFTSRTG